MYRVDNPTSSSILAATTPVVTEPGGRYFRQNATGGQTRTLIQSEWLLMVQEELAGVVLRAGEDLDKTRDDQLYSAIRILTGADDATGGSGSAGGSDITEPTADSEVYSRFRNPGERDGDWSRAIEEPPDDSRNYTRSVATLQTVGTWQSIAGRQRSISARLFYVAKTGDDTTGLGTTARPWRTIQKAVDFILTSVDANGFDVAIMVGDSYYPGVSLTPWEGFRATLPLQGALPIGLRIVGTSTQTRPELCQIDAALRPDLGLGVKDRCAVYAHNSRISISGFEFVNLENQGINIWADENTAIITLAGDIDFRPNPQGQANILARCGGQVHVAKDFRYRASPYCGYSCILATNAGVVTFAPQALFVRPDPLGAVYTGGFVALNNRSVCDLGQTGGVDGEYSISQKFLVAANSILSAGTRNVTRIFYGATSHGGVVVVGSPSGAPWPWG
jgi:hypothetical protein